MRSDDTGRHIADRALRALGISRATGAPWLACMTGVESVPADDRTACELRLGAIADLGRASAGLFDAAMLADLALGAAVRVHAGARRPLPLLSLTLELSPVPLPADISVRGRGEPAADGLARSYGTVLGGGTVIGHCLATFAVAASASDRVPLPWESAGPAALPDVLPESLNMAEQEMLTAVREVARGEPGSARAWTDELLAASCAVGPGSPAGTVLRPSAAMLNRSGQVQGAVLFWLAAFPPAAATGPDGMRMASGHLQCLSPAAPDVPLSASRAVLHSTRRTVFVRADIRQEDRPVASGAFTYRRTGRTAETGAGRQS